MHATGRGEVDWLNTSKLSQCCWSCITNENDYSVKTLMGNWNEEWYDIQRIVQPKPLPSQYTHCFETTYSSGFEERHWCPRHHPELEPPSFNPTAQSCYTVDYRPPYGSIVFACVRHSEKEQEGCSKSNTDGENLQTMPSERQEACLLAVLQRISFKQKDLSHMKDKRSIIVAALFVTCVCFCQLVCVQR
ncbi:LOW QUALITY PROTEIN: cilia- and flagella-associated protein 68 [Pterocles gutturalis]